MKQIALCPFSTWLNLDNFLRFFSDDLLRMFIIQSTTIQHFILCYPEYMNKNSKEKKTCNSKAFTTLLYFHFFSENIKK